MIISSQEAHKNKITGLNYVHDFIKQDFPFCRYFDKYNQQYSLWGDPELSCWKQKLLADHI